ncbi:MAG TPA: hypothetical protein VMK12_09705 [Anaeromyxobacteraceae bacterium]|nr:hypothetical protein [Anaeromyxobacteraceae bacterium]
MNSLAERISALELGGWVARFREQAPMRLDEIRSKAESFRAGATEKLGKLVIDSLGVATREQVDELLRELDRLSRRLEGAEKARENQPSAAEV